MTSIASSASSCTDSMSCCSDSPQREYISASRLNLWLKCPLAYKLKYIDGVAEPSSPSLLIGKQVHHAIEVFYRHRQIGVTIELDEIFNEMVQKWPSVIEQEGTVFGDVAHEAKAWEQIEEVVRTYVKQIPSDEPIPLAVETTLRTPLVDPETGDDLGIDLLGVIDLVLPSDEGAVICDFKTAASSKTPHEIAHELQLTCYAYLFRQASTENEAGLEIRSLVKTKVPQVSSARYERRTPRHFRRFFAVVRAYLDDLRRRQFLYRPTWSCSMCAYRDGECAQWNG